MLAEFKDLCIDAVDVERVATFWAAATGLTYDPNRGVLVGPTPQHTIWVRRVDRLHDTRGRIQLDIDADEIRPLMRAGATVASSSSPDQPWTVLTDPEGNELCAFVREPGSADLSGSYRVLQVVCDCVDAHAQVQWWSEVVGGRVCKDDQDRWFWLEDVPGMPFTSWVFVEVPEVEQVPNRLHWDVWTSSVEQLLAAGARLLRPVDRRQGWSVLADPEGNEFCAFVREEAA